MPANPGGAAILLPFFVPFYLVWSAELVEEQRGTLEITYGSDGRVKDASDIALGCRGPETTEPPPLLLQMPKTFRDCPVCPEMIVVPAGSFPMGENWHDDEKPVHCVTIPSTLAVGKYEVTRTEYAEFVEATGRADGDRCLVWTGSKWKKVAASNWQNPGFWQSDREPVVCVDWEGAQSYVRWLSDRTGQAYRLLTEAEWEYAARAGTTTRYWWGNDIGSGKANCRGCGSRWGGKKTAPVGSFSANPFGLHDTAGNVWEWVEDCWNENYIGAPNDGSAWTEGDCEVRVLRGGSWFYFPGDLRSASRSRYDSGLHYDYSGFRVARTLP